MYIRANTFSSTLRTYDLDAGGVGSTTSSYLNPDNDMVWIDFEYTTCLGNETDYRQCTFQPTIKTQPRCQTYITLYCAGKLLFNNESLFIKGSRVFIERKDNVTLLTQYIWDSVTCLVLY